MTRAALQPIYVDDLAKLAIEQGEKIENVIIDAVGPETFTYHELVEEIADAMEMKKPILHIPPPLGFFIGMIVGKIFGDITITRDEIEGLMAGLLYTDSKPVGTTRLTDWLKENASTVGNHYSSELARRKDREKAYEKL